MRIVYDNLVDDAEALTASTADPLYPIENVQNQRLAKRWRVTDGSAQTVVVDLGDPIEVSTVAILGHSIASGATLTISANATDSWGSPTYSTSLTYNTGVILRFLPSAQTFRYWQFGINDAGNTFEVGRLWLSGYQQIKPSSLLGFTVEKKRSDVVAYGRDRQKYATEGVGWRAFELSFPRTGGSALTAIQTVLDSIGQHKSVIFCNFDTDRSYEIVEPCYCSVEGDVAFRHTNRMRFEWSVTLEEDR